MPNITVHSYPKTPFSPSSGWRGCIQIRIGALIFSHRCTYSCTGAFTFANNDFSAGPARRLPAPFRPENPEIPETQDSPPKKFHAMEVEFGDFPRHGSHFLEKFHAMEPTFVPVVRPFPRRTGISGHSGIPEHPGCPPPPRATASKPCCRRPAARFSATRRCRPRPRRRRRDGSASPRRFPGSRCGG